MMRIRIRSIQFRNSSIESRNTYTVSRWQHISDMPWSLDWAFEKRLSLLPQLVLEEYSAIAFPPSPHPPPPPLFR